MATQEKVDVAIIGAGPAGSIFADVLTRAGKNAREGIVAFVTCVLVNLVLRHAQGHFALPGLRVRVIVLDCERVEDLFLGHAREALG